MKYFLLVGVCSISILSSCNFKPKTYEVSMVSNTLVVDNATATENKDYEATISLVDPTKDYRLPDLIVVTISDKALTDTDYTYDSSSGQLKINANVINNKITITGEATPLEVYKVNMSSSTLTIDNSSATESRAYKGVISLVEPNEDYRLPTLITITVSDKTLTDEDYTYNFNTGLLEINANVITNDIKIIGERAELDSYKADFICDGHIKVFIYKTRDYDIEPRRTNLAYARDKNSGDLLKDGTGEINFKVEIDENYDIDMLWVKGLYDKCQDSEKTEKDDVYRITKIRSDLQITITTKKIYCKNLKAFDDLSTKSFSFSWTMRKPDNVKQVLVDITTKDGTNRIVSPSKESYTFDNAAENKMYTFNFIVELNNGIICDPISITRFIGQKDSVSGLPRVEIDTENNVIPEVKRPVANYVQNILKIYDASNQLIYDSGTSEKAGKEYDGSKIKIRGNATSTFRKKSYKIKLKNDADLLKNFRFFSDAFIDYTNKEWCLLAPNIGNKLKTSENSEILSSPIGFTIANTLDFDWKPAYQFVTVYLNADYQGLYILCEQTAKGNGIGDSQSRYKIDDDGYIVEKNYYWGYEDLIIETPINGDGKSQYTFKYPDTDDFNSETQKYNYIKNILVELENKIMMLDTTCFEIIDESSLVRWLLGHDIIANEDYLGSNIFLYKKDSSNSTILSMGTIWDYGQSLRLPNRLANIRTGDNFYYKYLLQLDGFKQEIRNLWEESKLSIKNAINDCLDDFSNNLYNSLLQVESKRWEFTLITIENQKEVIRNFFSEHYIYLDNNL